MDVLMMPKQRIPDVNSPVNVTACFGIGSSFRFFCSNGFQEKSFVHPLGLEIRIWDFFGYLGAWVLGYFRFPYGRFQLQRFNEPSRLGHRFVVFRLGMGIGHDAGAGMEPCRAFAADRGANGDGKLTFAIKTEIPERAGVGTARDRLKFVDDLHRADFRRAGDAPAGKTRREGSEVRYVGAQSSLDRRNEMLHMRVALE